MSKNRRLLLALAVAPLMTLVTFDIYGFFTEKSMPNSADLFGVMLFSSLFLWLIAGAVFIVFGFPVWAIFRRFRILSIPAFVLAGGISGLIVGLLFSGGTYDPGRSTLCIVAAAASALVFRLIAPMDREI